MSAVPTTTERFQAFRANHGPLESPLADRLLGVFFERAIFRFYEYPQRDTLQKFVSDRMKEQAHDILAVLELAADWSADPMAAAGRQLRTELDAKTQADAAAWKAKEYAELKAAIQAKADSFAASLTAAGPAPKAPKTIATSQASSPGDK